MIPELPPVPELWWSPADSTPVVRLLVGLAGALLLVVGARIYRGALLLAGFGVGSVATVLSLRFVGEYIPIEDSVVIPATLMGGVVLAGITSVVHRMGLLAVGGFVGAGVATGLAALFGDVEWWVPTIGSLVGSVAISWAFPHLLKVLTPLVGSVLVAWAAGVLDRAGLLAVLWLGGSAVQLYWSRPEPES